MNKIVEALKKAGTFFIATEDGEQPRVRPFGAVLEYDGKPYLCTGNTKPCFAQMKANPKVEISATYPDHTWLRLTAKVEPIDNDSIRAAMLEEYPELKGMYHVGDGIFEVLEIKEASRGIYSFVAEPVKL